MPFPVAFHGASFFIDNIRAFGRAALVRDEAVTPALFGVKVESFLTRAWWDAEGRVSAEPWLAPAPESIVDRIVRGQCTLLFDMSGEGPAFMEDRVAALHATLARRRIEPERCVLLQQNRRLRGDYAAWALQRGTPPMRVLDYDYYPRRMAGLLRRMDRPHAPNPEHRAKHYLCPNFTPKRHRTSLVSWLLGEGFAEAGFISFRADSKNDAAHVLTTSPAFPASAASDRGLQMLKAREPLVLDLPEVAAGEPDFSMIPERFYDQSYFSIVTDSNISADVVRFTEKVIKPLSMFHPVILLGFPGSLALLRDFGFETFGGMFDETYDRIDPAPERVSAFLTTLRRVLEFDRDTLHGAYHRLRDILDHNAEVARRLLDDRYRTLLDEQLLREIMRDEPASPEASWDTDPR